MKVFAGAKKVKVEEECLFRSMAVQKETTDQTGSQVTGCQPLSQGLVDLKKPLAFTLRWEGMGTDVWYDLTPEQVTRGKQVLKADDKGTRIERGDPSTEMC